VVGYHAYIVRTGAQALDLLKHMRPAAMILDANLAETDPYDVLRTIRQRHNDQHFPILMTGRGLTVDDVRRALGHGAQNCMVKPFSGSDAVERIGRLIEAAHQPAPRQVEVSRPVAYV